MAESSYVLWNKAEDSDDDDDDDGDVGKLERKESHFFWTHLKRSIH